MERPLLLVVALAASACAPTTLDAHEVDVALACADERHDAVVAFPDHDAETMRGGCSDWSHCSGPEASVGRIVEGELPLARAELIVNPSFMSRTYTLLFERGADDAYLEHPARSDDHIFCRVYEDQWDVATECYYTQEGCTVSVTPRPD